MAKAAHTQLALMRAAEALFADHSVTAVSMREVTAAAGQRNVSSVFYHFGSKDELLERVLERHSEPMQKHFQQCIESRGHAMSLRELIEMLVSCLLAKFEDADGGRNYLALIAQLAASPDFPLIERRCMRAPGMVLFMQSLMKHTGPLPPMLYPLRLARFTNVMSLSFVDFIRLSKAGVHVPRELFQDELISALILTVTGDPRQVASV